MVEGLPASVCIVDDDLDFTKLLIEYLEARGLSATAFSSAEALLASDELPRQDLFVIDLGLPGLDGVDLIALIRARSQAGILIVSGRMGADAFNSALVAGGDMFINKPVRFDQVFHAIASIWRRLARQVSREVVWHLHHDERMLETPGGVSISLSPLEFRIISTLSAAGSNPVSRATLAEECGIAESVDHRNLDAAMFRFRRKIEDQGHCPAPFRTVHGVGYKLNEQVTRLDQP